jgi:hypothetical protein
MGRETTVTLVNESALETLRSVSLRKTPEHILRVIGMRWKNQPSTE